MTLAVVPPPQQQATLAPTRIPPNDLGAERAVLGACLLDAECWTAVAPMLKAECFYADKHGTIWRAFEALARAGQPIDTVLLTSELETHGNLKRAGDHEYVLGLTDTIPTVDNVEAHAKIVLDKWQLRETIHAAYQIAAEAYEGVESVDDYAIRAAGALATIRDRRSSGSDSISLGKAAAEELAIIERRAASGQTMLGHATGFGELDDLLSGLCNGDLYLIGAGPGMGKTAFINALKLGVARSAGMQVLSFEYEMSREQLVHRLWSAEVEINMRMIRGATLSAAHLKQLAKGSERLARLPIELIFNRSFRTSDIVRYAHRRLRTHGPIGLITVDYGQRVPPDDPRQSREQQMSELARAMKTLAGDAQCPVAMISSLNRDFAKRPDKRPIESDLRDSGQLEYEADTILFLYRDERYYPNTPENLNEPGRTEIICPKQRSGPAPATRLVRFTKEYTRFDNWEAQRHEAQQGFGYEDER